MRSMSMCSRQPNKGSRSFASSYGAPTAQVYYGAFQIKKFDGADRQLCWPVANRNTAREGSMKSRLVFGSIILFTFAFSSAALAQFSSDPSKNFALTNVGNGADQVQPKLKALPNNGWYVS